MIARSAPHVLNLGGADAHAIRYRADVDGLRAIAVLSVVGFHLWRHTLPGGYLGVDMFFVISGFLITAIICADLSSGRFSVMRFYDRRIRRIVPALLVILAVTACASVWLLLPADLVGFARSLLATLVVSTNLYFWRDTNYFAAAADQKPLLHLWSLAIEEQFYAIFPFVMLWVARWSARGRIQFMLLLVALSYAGNLCALFLGGDAPAFFLLPTRAWELGVGALLAMRMQGAAIASKWVVPAAWLGALLIVVGVLHPIERYWFCPAALPTVAGTALLIAVGRHHSPIIRCLALPPVVFIGAISYSLYLWHWPIIVFGQYVLVRDFTFPEAMLAVLAMFACALVTWRCVERPFRNPDIPVRVVRGAAMAGALALGSLAVGLLEGRGFPARLNAEASVVNAAVDTNYRCPLANYLPFGRSRACAMNLPSKQPRDADVVLLGNSHAQMYEPLWESILTQRGETGLLVPVNGCLPTVQSNLNRDCIDIAGRNLREVATLTRVRTVIVGLNWSHGVDDLVDRDGRVVDNSHDAALIAALDDLIGRLKSTGKHVVLIGPLAEPGWNVASILSRDIAFGRQTTPPLFIGADEFARRFGPAIRHFEQQPDIEFARPDRVQCPGNRCYYVLDGHALFADANHIATAELPRFRGVFAAALPDDRP